MKTVENYAARLEQLLNPIDYIPYVSTFSGVARFVAGLIEIVAAGVFAAYRAMRVLFTNKGCFFNVFERAFIYTLHGMANMVRGAIAIYPWWNLLLVVHDFKLGRFNYPEEDVRKDVYPIATAYKFVEH